MDRLRNLFRNSPWVMIAVAIHLIVIAGAAIFYTASHGPSKTDEAATIRLAPTRPEIEELAIPETIDRKSIPKNEEAELVSIEEDVYIPTTEEVPEDLYQDRGDPNSLDSVSDASTGGTAIGVGSVGHAGLRPSPFASRRLGTGVGKGRTGGATAGTERAVLEGLRWLARHQNEDGSWGATTFSTHCTTNPPCVPQMNDLGTRFDVGMTALCLLAFLGQGISIDSKIHLVDTAMGKKRSGGEIVKKGIQWLLSKQREDGSFSTEETFAFPENDTLPTMAICEAYGLSRARILKRPAQAAFDFLIAAQKRDANGVRSGWGPGSYAHIAAQRDRGDLDEKEFAQASQVVDPTITCWVVMALQSAELCGLEVPSDVLPAALDFVVKTSEKEATQSAAIVDDGDKYVYHRARNMALGMLTRTFAGGPIADTYLERGANDLAADVPEVGKDGLSIDFYYWYFGTLALNQFDGPDSPRPGKGKAWGKWNRALVDAILPLQDQSTEKNKCSRGGWLQGTRGNRKGMEVRNTALNIMTLEVYYRFDNVFGAARSKRN